MNNLDFVLKEVSKPVLIHGSLLVNFLLVLIDTIGNALLNNSLYNVINWLYASSGQSDSMILFVFIHVLQRWVLKIDIYFSLNNFFLCVGVFCACLLALYTVEYAKIICNISEDYSRCRIGTYVIKIYVVN